MVVSGTVKHSDSLAPSGEATDARKQPNTSSIAGRRMDDVTGILPSIEEGDQNAAEQLLPLVYDELRKLAAQKLAQEKPA
jgi:hypothetical protein